MSIEKIYDEQLDEIRRDRINEYKESQYDIWKDENIAFLQYSFCDENNDDFEMFCRIKWSNEND